GGERQGADHRLRRRRRGAGGGAGPRPAADPEIRLGEADGRRDRAAVLPPHAQGVRRMRRLAWALLAAALSTTAGAESVLRVVPLNELKVLDPIWSTGYTSRDHGYLIYDTLFATDETGAPKPQMVERWSVSDDRLTWTFTLRDGLKWHDGGPV